MILTINYNYLSKRERERDSDVYSIKAMAPYEKEYANIAVHEYIYKHEWGLTQKKKKNNNKQLSVTIKYN